MMIPDCIDAKMYSLTFDKLVTKNSSAVQIVVLVVIEGFQNSMTLNILIMFMC